MRKAKRVSADPKTATRALHWSEHRAGPDWKNAGGDVALPAQVATAIYPNPDNPKVVMIRQGGAAIEIARGNAKPFIEAFLRAAGCTDVSVRDMKP